MRPTNLAFLLLIFLGLPTLIWSQEEAKSILFPELNYSQHTLVKFRTIRTRSLPLIQSLLPYAPLPMAKADSLDEEFFLKAYYTQTIQKAVQLGLTDRQIVSDSLALKVQEDYKAPTKAYRLFTSRTKRYDKSKRIRYTLNKGLPVLVGFKNRPDWSQVAGTATWDGKGLEGSHQMVIIGYDSRTTSFQLVDANGQKWGPEGMVWMTAINLLANAKEIVSFKNPTLVKKATTTEAIPLSIDLSIKASELQQPESRNPYLKAMDVQFDDQKGYYTFPNTAMSPEHGRYQLAINIPRGRCAYLFVSQPDGNTTPAWMMEYNLQDTTVILPPVSYYQFPDVGANYFFILLSNQPIPRWRRYVDRYEFNEKNQSAREKLYTAFKSYLVPMEKIKYEQEQMNAQVQLSTTTDKQVVPIIIEWVIKEE